MTGMSRRAISGPFWDKTNPLFGLLKAAETKGFLRVNLPSVIGIPRVAKVTAHDEQK